MFRNYLKIAFRSLARYKFISFINLFGLTIGLSCCLIILTYLVNETSYDKFNKKADRIYRITRSFNNDQGIVSLHLSAVAPPIAPLMQNDFREIEKITRLLPAGTTPVRYGDKLFNEQNVAFADSNLLGVFDIKLLKGSPRTVLSEPYTAAMTPEAAHRYFGDTDPMGKVIRLNNRINVTVTGIFSPLPPNSHFHSPILLSFSTLEDSTIVGKRELENDWGGNAFYTYLLLPEKYNARSLEARLPAFLDRHMAEPGTAANNMPSRFTKLYLQPLKDIHLRSHLDDEYEENGDINRVYIFSAIALFILIIACINYMNLSTARSSLRAKEIGIRKVSGALRTEIILQFLSESTLLSYVAMLLALGLTWLTLPMLNNLTGLNLSAVSLAKPLIITPLILTPLAVGILSGLYPAFILSSFQPSKVLKGLFKVSGGNLSLRKALVVVQFSVSIVLLISTVVIFRQLHYIQNASLGFNKDHILVMNYNEGLDKNFEGFRNALLEDPHVVSAALSSRIPSGRLLDYQDAATESGDSLRPISANIKYLKVDQDFLKTYGIPILAGRDFSRQYATDSTGFVLNAAATRALGLPHPQDLVGKSFRYGDTKGRVIGIMGDFNFESMHQAILPMILAVPGGQNSRKYSHLSIKIAGNDAAGAIAHIEAVWRRYVPEIPFEYNFLDEKFDRLYQSEQRQGSLFTTFSGIAIFIACLGLLGLSAFSISQRIKEIGVRKVLGASTKQIVQLLSADFLKLVAIAAAIACPIGWFLMHGWLQDFAYRTSISWWIFLAAGALAATVALITISVQAVRAAMSNPAKSLRSE